MSPEPEFDLPYGLYLRWKNNYWIVYNKENFDYPTRGVICRRCITTFNWIDEWGNLRQYPVSVGKPKEASDYVNVQFANPGGFNVFYMQLDQYSKYIRPNDRFMLGNTGYWTSYKVQGGGVSNYLREETMNSTETNTESTFDYNVAGFRSHCMSRFELLYHDKQFQQFKNFRLVRANANIGKYIHTAYYDIDTMSIHYSNVSIKKSNNYSTHVGRQQFEASWVNIDGGYDEHDTQQMEGKPFKRADDTDWEIYSDGDYNITLGDSQFTDELSRSSATSMMSWGSKVLE